MHQDSAQQARQDPLQTGELKQIRNHPVPLHRAQSNSFEFLQRRKTSAINEISLAELRNLAIQIDETCFELKYELQTVVIEQSDELDRSNSQLNLIKQLKHYCLVGDYERTLQLSLIFQEQTEQLVEICKTLNQISPTHKMKITTKSLAIWFELNLPQLLENFKFLSQNPRSKILKDCTWSYVHGK